MNELDHYRELFRAEAPIRPDAEARADAIAAAMAHAAGISARRQESAPPVRLRDRIAEIWNRRTAMHSFKLRNTMMAGASLAAVMTLVIAAPALHRLMTDTALAPPPAPPLATTAPVPQAADAGRTAGSLQAPKDKSPATAAGEDAEADLGYLAPQAAPQVSDSLAAGGNAVSGAVAMKEAVQSQPMPAPASVAPGEGRDRFRDFDANPVKEAAAEPLSTFSIDVDTSSYSFLRRSLMEGVLPPKDAVRVEEMVNYFPYDYQGPADRSEPFEANVGLMATPWNKDTLLMRIGIRGFAPAAAARPHANLVFLIDTSGSMEEPDKLPLLVNSFRLLLDTLKPEDSVAIVTYAGSAGTVLEPTRVADRDRILAALDGLTGGGSTAGAEGIRAAYALAQRNFDAAGVNRVILATDGDFNVGISDPRELEDYISRQRASGIYLSVLGFGEGNYNDELMQALAQNGNGNAAYIDTLNEARKVLVDEAGSTLFPIANDVKIQVEFNPATVSEYRLIGYETRLLAKEDFNNDKVDAGDIGAGHTVTALYEVTPKNGTGQHVDPLRYGTAPAPAPAAASSEYAFVKIRYKLPGQPESRLITRPVTAADETASAETGFAAAVAAFGQILRGGQYTGSFGYDDVIALATASRGGDPYGYRSEFINLVRLAKSARVVP